MSDDALKRIADALERFAALPGRATDWNSAPAYIWDGVSARAIAAIEAPPLDLLRGIRAQKETVVENVSRLAAGHAAHDMLLWGARGMGKSALLRASVAAAQQAEPQAIGLVQLAADAVASLPSLFAALRQANRNFLVFVDDLGFADDDAAGPRHLRSVLEGGVEARPPHVRLAVTANRRAIVPRDQHEQDDPINPRDVVDDRLALADRFGLSVGFHKCSQDDYLAIVDAYAQAAGLDWEPDEALAWAKRRGARSGRTAWQFVTELAGRASRSI